MISGHSSVAVVLMYRFWQIVFGAWCWLATIPAWGQGESDYWYFGTAAVHFTPTGPVALPGQGLDSEEGSASVSDAAGKLFFYTDGSTIWTRQHEPMPHGTGLGLPYQYSATQGALIIQDPGNTSRYYVFRQAAYTYPNGLGYVIVDMRLNGGLGDTVGPLVTLEGASSSLSEKLTGVVHANGRDTWVLTHGAFGSNTYYAYLLSPTGVSALPVTTAVGLPHGSALGGSGEFGYLRASPNGTKLAAAVATGPIGQLELLDFDPATGRPSNPLALVPARTAAAMYGVEFSADGAKLYATDEIAIYQYDLLAVNAVAASRVQVGRPQKRNASAHALQRGPDGRIYVAQQTQYLGVIAQPSVRGLACDYREQGLWLGGVGQFPGRAEYGLPNFPNQFATPGRVMAHIATESACPGEPVTFTASLGPAPIPVGATYSWDFGDPNSGAANAGTGLTTTHRYAAGGTYLVGLRVQWSNGEQQDVLTTTLVNVFPGPALSLAPRTRQLCAGSSLLLDAGPAAAGVTYTWQDGTPGSTYTVQTPGTYWLTARSAQGCQVRDSVVVRLAPAPQVSLGPDTVTCDSAPSVLLRASAQPAGTSYRWQDGSTSPTYLATQPGPYSVVVTNSSGCTAHAQVTVRQRTCPVVIPNIITPNGDRLNEYWVLQGLDPAECALTIYSRWGTQVYATAAYNNHWQAAGLAAGNYYYLLQDRRSGQRYRGWVEVIK
jgi:gliding motility-associated-like protein